MVVIIIIELVRAACFVVSVFCVYVFDRAFAVVIFNDKLVALAEAWEAVLKIPACTLTIVVIFGIKRFKRTVGAVFKFDRFGRDKCDTIHVVARRRIVFSIVCVILGLLRYYISVPVCLLYYKLELLPEDRQCCSKARLGFVLVRFKST